MEPKTPPKLEEFMRILNRTGFDPTDICNHGLEYSIAHPYLQSMMYASAEQVEDAMKSLGIHAEFQKQHPFVDVAHEGEAQDTQEWKEAGWKPSDFLKYKKGPGV